MNFYKNIKELKEGTFLLHENGKSHLHSYLHQAPIEHRHEKENTLVQRVETLLSESLQLGSIQF